MNAISALESKLNTASCPRGVFYTPQAYAEKALELLKTAIAAVPPENDYVIIDRCAGTGNLEKPMDAPLLSHCILSTLGKDEHRELSKSFSGRVRQILPPSDALSLDFIENPLIKSYIDNPRCSIILYENPPFSEPGSLERQKKSSVSGFSVPYAQEEMKKHVKGSAPKELCNVFIWSAFKYYIRQSGDFYIVFSPLKCWKSQHLIDRRFISGFGFNRRHFGTRTDCFIMAALWGFEKDYKEKLQLEAYDIEPKSGMLKAPLTLELRRIHSLYSRLYYDRRPFPDESYDGVLVGLDGREAKPGASRRVRPLYSSQMLGYLVADSSGFDNPDSKSGLLSAGRCNGSGFFLHKDNYLIKLPMFAASRYASYNRSWTERGRIGKSADGAEQFRRDCENGSLQQWLLRCLLFCCLDGHNHMRSFYGSDGRCYRNELCLDLNNGSTLASRALKELNKGPREEELLFRWQRLLSEAADCPEYNEDLTYGVYQIETDIDSSQRLNTGRIIYKNTDVHSEFLKLRKLLKAYYLSEIVPTLFKYEFLK